MIARRRAASARLRFAVQARAAALALGASAVLFGHSSAQAATDTWIGNGSNTSFTTGFNATPANGDTLFFGIPGSGGLTVTDNQTLTAGAANTDGVDFGLNAGAFSIGGSNTLTLASSGTGIGINDLALNSETFTAPIALASNQTFNVTNMDGTLGVGSVSGAFTLTKTGAGLLSLNSTASFANLVILGGVVQAGGDNNLGASGGSITIDSGTLRLSLAGNFGYLPSSTRPIKLGDSGAGTGGTIDTANATGTFGGVLSNNGGTNSFTKTGTGTLTLSGANTYTGTTYVNQGGLSVDYNAKSDGASATASSQIISASSALVLGGTPTVLGGVADVNASFNAQGASGGARTQTFAGLTLNPGENQIAARGFTGASSNMTLAFGTITRNPGSAVSFSDIGSGVATAQGIFTTTNANSTVANAGVTTTGILGGWAVINSVAGGVPNTTGFQNPTDYATVNGSNQIVAYTGYTAQAAGAITAGAANNNRVSATGGVALTVAAGTTDINTLSNASTATGNTTVTIASGGILRLGASGGLFTANSSGAINISGGTLTAGGAANTAGEINLIGAGGGSPFSISSVIADNGSGAVTLTATQYANNNFLALSGNNTYSGGTYLNSGRTNPGSNTAFGTGPVNISAHAQVILGFSGATMANAFNISGASQGNNDTPSAIRFTGGQTLSGTITMLGDATIALRNATGNVLSGQITGNYNLTIAQSGASGGAITLSNTANNWGGNLSTDEKIILGASNVLPDGTATGNVFINNSGTLELNGFSDTINGLGGSATVGQGTVQNTSTGASVLTIGGNNQTSTFNGLVTDGGAGKTLGITKTGTGLLILGDTANTYAGGTTVNGGTLRLGGTISGTNSTIGKITGALTVNTGGTLDLGGNNQTVGAFSGTGGTVTNSSTTAAILTVGDATTLTTYAGAIQDGTNGGTTVALTKQGSGTLDLTGANTYTGATSVTAGVLEIGSGGSINAASPVTLSGTASLALGDGSGFASQTLNSLTTTSTTPVVGGAGMYSTLTLNNAGSTTFANVFGGAGTNQNNLNLVIAGTGATPTSIFSGLSTYTGFTQVNSGSTLNLLNGSISGSALTLNSGGTLTGTGNNSTTGVVGSLTASGGSAITLSGAGGTALRSSGAISLGGTGTYGAGVYTTLNYTLAGASAVESLNTPVVLTLNSGGAYVNIVNPTTVGTYTLANYASLAGSGSFSLSSTAPGVTSVSIGRNTETLTTNATSLVLTIAGAAAPNVAFFNGAVSNAFNDVTTSASLVNFSTNKAGTTDAGNVPSANTDVILVADDATDASHRNTTNITATLGASTTINSLNAISAASSGLTSFTLAADGSTLTIAGLADSNTSSDGTYTGNAAGNGISLASGAAPLTINVPVVVGTGGANQTWTNNSASLLTVGGTVTGSGTGAQTLTLSNTSTGGMTLSGVIANPAAGTLALAVNNTGSGATIFSGANTYSGGTTLTAGLLQLSGSGTLGGTSAALTVNGGSLDFGGTSQTVGNFTGTGGTVLNSVTGAKTFTIGTGNGTGGNFAGVIEDNAGTGGTLAVVKVGTGTLTLSGTDAYSGGTTVNQGTLTSAVAGGFGTGNVTVSPTGSSGTSADAATLNTNGSIASTAVVTVNSNSATAIGTVNFNDATPAIASLLGNGKVVLNNATGTNLTIGGTNASPTFTGVISEGTAGKGSLTKTGTGTLTLSGTNTYTGGTTVNGGTLTTTDNVNAFGTNGAGNVVTIGSAGTVLINSSASNTYSDTFTGSGLLKFNLNSGGSDTIANNFNAFTGILELANTGGSSNKLQIASSVPTALASATLQIDNGAQYFTGGDVNFGSINIIGTGNGEGRGAIRLNGNGTTSGVIGGSVVLQGNTTIGNEGGVLTGNISTGVAGTSTLTMGTGNSNGTALLSGNLSNGTGTLALTASNGTTILTGTNTYTGVTTINSGAMLQLGDGTTGHDGTVATTSGITDNGTLIYNRFGSTSSDRVISGTGAVTKSGAGTQTLTGNNTYSGITTISGGTLLVNGTHTGAGAVGVSGTGTTLGGSGMLTAAVNVGANANLSPGGTTAAGATATFTVGALTLASSSNYNVDVATATAGSGYDQVVTTGAVSLNGSNLVLNVSGAGLNVGDKLFILDNGSGSAITGTFAGYADGATINSGSDSFTISYFATGDSTPGNDISLTVTAVPEPSTWAAGLLGLGAVGFHLRRRMGWLSRKRQTAA